MEAQHAALRRVSEKQKRVREQKAGYVFGGDDVSNYVGDHGASKGVEERVSVHQNELAAGSVWVGEENVIASGGVGSGRAGRGLTDVHGERRGRLGIQRCVPVRFHPVEILGTLNGGCELSRSGAARV